MTMCSPGFVVGWVLVTVAWIKARVRNSQVLGLVLRSKKSQTSLDAVMVSQMVMAFH